MLRESFTFGLELDVEADVDWTASGWACRQSDTKRSYAESRAISDAKE